MLNFAEYTDIYYNTKSHDQLIKHQAWPTCINYIIPATVSYS